MGHAGVLEIFGEISPQFCHDGYSSVPNPFLYVGKQLMYVLCVQEVLDHCI